MIILSSLLTSCFALVFILWLHNVIHHSQHITESLASQFHSLLVHKKCHLQATDRHRRRWDNKLGRYFIAGPNVVARRCMMWNINIHSLLDMSRQWQWSPSPIHTCIHTQTRAGLLVARNIINNLHVISFVLIIFVRQRVWLCVLVWLIGIHLLKCVDLHNPPFMLVELCVCVFKTIWVTLQF